MVPFVPLDNATGIRRIQRRTIKRCFDLASTRLKLLHLPRCRTLREAFARVVKRRWRGMQHCPLSQSYRKAKKTKERKS